MVVLPRGGKLASLLCHVGGHRPPIKVLIGRVIRLVFPRFLPRVPGSKIKNMLY